MSRFGQKTGLHGLVNCENSVIDFNNQAIRSRNTSLSSGYPTILFIDGQILGIFHNSPIWWLFFRFENVEQRTAHQVFPKLVFQIHSFISFQIITLGNAMQCIDFAECWLNSEEWCWAELFFLSICCFWLHTALNVTPLFPFCSN